MAVPKRKTSKRRTKIKRASRYKKKAVHTVKCKNCKADKLPHRECSECGKN